MSTTLDKLIPEHIVATAFDQLRVQALAAGLKPPSPGDVDTIRRVGAIARAQLAIDEINLALEGGARRTAHGGGAGRGARTGTGGGPV